MKKKFYNSIKLVITQLFLIVSVTTILYGQSDPKTKSTNNNETNQFIILSTKQIMSGLSKTPRFIAAEKTVEKEFSSELTRLDKLIKDNEKLSRALDEEMRKKSNNVESEAEQDRVTRLWFDRSGPLTLEKNKLNEAKSKLEKEREIRREEVFTPIYQEVTRFFTELAADERFKRRINLDIIRDRDLVLWESPNLAAATDKYIEAYNYYVTTKSLPSGFDFPTWRVAILAHDLVLKREKESPAAQNSQKALESYATANGYGVVLKMNSSMLTNEAFLKSIEKYSDITADFMTYYNKSALK